MKIARSVPVTWWNRGEWAVERGSVSVGSREVMLLTNPGTPYSSQQTYITAPYWPVLWTLLVALPRQIRNLFR